MTYALIASPTHGNITVLGGLTGVDEYGDVTDGTTVLASGLCASILEQSRAVKRLDTQEPGVVRFLAARLPYGTPVTHGCRLRDETTGQVWVVDRATRTANPVMVMDVVCDVRDIS